MKAFVIGIIMLFCLVSCATGSAIVTGKARPAIDPSMVQIYMEEPTRLFEAIGMVHASSDVEISEQAAWDRVIKELKRQAAKIGANGIVLLKLQEKSSYPVTFFGLYGWAYTVTQETVKAKAIAIYVRRF